MRGGSKAQSALKEENGLGVGRTNLCKVYVDVIDKLYYSSIIIFLPTT